MQNLGLSQVHWAFVRLELEGERHLAGGIKVALHGRTLKVEEIAIGRDAWTSWRRRGSCAGNVWCI